MSTLSTPPNTKKSPFFVSLFSVCDLLHFHLLNFWALWFASRDVEFVVSYTQVQYSLVDARLRCQEYEVLGDR